MDDYAANLRTSAEAYPDRIAVRIGAESLTYTQLDARVDAAASALQESGIGKGDRVALLLGNGISYVVALHATLRIGGVVIPINTALTAPEVAHELTDSAAKAMVVGEAYVDTVAKLRGTLPQLATVLVADTTHEVAPDLGMRSWHAALSDRQGSRPAPVEIAADDVALLAYTSGTTGYPRGAMLTHGQLLANQQQMRDSGLAATPDDVVFTPLPTFHIYALNVAMGMALSSGATLEIVERFEPAGSMALVAERGVTVIVGAPTVYVAWVNTPGAEPATFSGVRLATSGAAPLSPKVWQRCVDELGLDIREGYGLTEAAPVVTTSAGLLQGIPGCVGPPLEGVELRITDGGAAVEDGEIGDVEVRGPNVFSGYHGDPDATAHVLLPDGWLHTGDVGYLEHGMLYLVDRAKDLVIVSGFNVYPAEVEAALLSHAAVDQAAVVGVPHPYTGEAVKAFVVLKPGAQATADALIKHTEGLLARFKRPETVEFVDSIPVLPSGKVRRRLLRESK